MTRESACASAVKHISQRAKSCHPAFFQAEDGIRDSEVTGVQTCALPIRSEEHTSELQSPQNLVCRLIRSEEHTSELQSPQNLVCRLLLEKKNKWGVSLLSTSFLFNETASTVIVTVVQICVLFFLKEGPTPELHSLPNPVCLLI